MAQAHQFLPSKLAAVPRLASRFTRQPPRGLQVDTEYCKRVTRLSNKIFVEPTRPVSVRSQVVLRVMTEEPVEQREDKSFEYYPNLPMFHYLTKMLRLHGLYMDEHVIWRQVQDELLMMRGKIVRPPIGQGKRAQLRAGKK